MEDTLGVEVKDRLQRPRPTVLILVLMEDTLGVQIFMGMLSPAEVLILVLMEDTLGD